MSVEAFETRSYANQKEDEEEEEGETEDEPGHRRPNSNARSSIVDRKLPGCTSITPTPREVTVSTVDCNCISSIRFPRDLT